MPKSWVKTEFLHDGGCRFIVSPLVRGMGNTIGNSLRRVLLSSLKGVAITALKIEGVSHEFSTLPNVVEDVLDIVFNLKNIVFKLDRDEKIMLSLSHKGKGQVLAKHIKCPAGVSIINPDQHIAEVIDKGVLNLEISLESGYGYQSSTANLQEDLPINFISLDASFSPIVRVNHQVDTLRIGKSLNYDTLTLDVWTNGSIDPEFAVQEAASLLAQKFSMFKILNQKPEEEIIYKDENTGNVENFLLMSIDDLELSARSSNCLKRAGIDTVGMLIQKDMSELIQIKNFGKKSADEINDKLKQFNMSLKGYDE